MIKGKCSDPHFHNVAPYSVKHFPNKKIDCGVFDNLRLPPLLSKSTEKTRNVQHNTMAANPHPCAIPWGVCMSMFIKSHILIERDFFCWLVRKLPSTLGIGWVLAVFKGIQKNTGCKLGGLWQGDWHRQHWVYLQWTSFKATGCCDGACQVWTKEYQETVALIAIQVQGTSNNFKIKNITQKLNLL